MKPGALSLPEAAPGRARERWRMHQAPCRLCWQNCTARRPRLKLHVGTATGVLQAGGRGERGGGRARAHGALEVLVVGQRAQLQAEEHEQRVRVAARAALARRHHVEQQVQEHGPHELRAARGPPRVSAAREAPPC